jgi:hypothetical protein
LGDDDAVSRSLSVEFKPLLKMPGRSSDRRSPESQARRATDDLRAAVLEVVRRRPGQLYQKQCVRLLAGDATEASLQRDRSFGACSTASKVAIQSSIRSLMARGDLVIGRADKLEPAGPAVATDSARSR